jgi:predicted anti-sigma-YlaC factor YlaD
VDAPGSRPDDFRDPTAGALDEIHCRDFVEMITDYFEDALAPRSLEHVEEHLVMCDWCVAYLGQMEATLNSLRELGSESDVGVPYPDRSTLPALETRRNGER